MEKNWITMKGNECNMSWIGEEWKGKENIKIKIYEKYLKYDTQHKGTNNNTFET